MIRWASSFASVAFALCCADYASAKLPAAGGEGAYHRDGARRLLEIPRGGFAPRGGGSDIFDNPGFENRTGNQPNNWATHNEPELRTEENPDSSINHFAHVSRANYYFTPSPEQFAFHVPAWQTVSVGARVKGRTGFEQPLFYWELTNPDSGETRYHGVFRGNGDVTDWSPFYASFTRLPNEPNSFFMISSLADLMWVDFDDLFRVDEGIANGGFESDESSLTAEPRWHFTAGAGVTVAGALSGTRSLSLPPGGNAGRLVAHSPFAVEYFLSGRASGSFQLAENHFAPNGEAWQALSEAVTPDGSGRFFVGPIPSTGEGEIAEVNLASISNTTVLVDDVSRGWVCAWPKVLEPVANSANGSIRLGAAWPGELDTAEIAILDDNGVEVDRLTTLLRDDSTVWVEYDGGALAAGVYTARFELTGINGQFIAPEQVFELRRGAAWPAVLDDYPHNDFERVAWMWLYPERSSPADTTLAQMKARMQSAIDDGFNVLWISVRQSQYALVKQSAAELNIPYMIAPVDFDYLFDPPQGNATHDPIGILNAMSALEIFRNVPLCRGLYLRDEPNVAGVHEVDRVTDVARLLQREGGYPPVVTFLNWGASRAGADFPFFCTFYYPFGMEAKLPEDALQEIIAPTEQDVAQAIAQGRDYWMGTQGYALVDNIPVMRGAECNAQLGIGLALGMKSYFVFTYTTIDSLGGLRTQAYGPTERLTEGYAKFNARMDVIGSTIRSLPMERTTPAQSNVLVRIAHPAGGDYHAFVVNTHPDSTLTFSATTTAASQMVNIETNATTATGTVHSGALGKGEWAIFRFTNGAEPTSFTAVLSPVDFPDTAGVIVRGTIPTPDAPTSIALKPDGAAVATTIGTLHTVYSLEAENFGGVLFNEDRQAMNGAVRYFDNSTLFLGSQRIGPRVYNQQGSTFTPVYSQLKETGGGIDASPAGMSLFLTQEYWGVEFVQRTGLNSFFSKGHFFAPYNGFKSIHGPFPDASVIAVETVGGLYRVHAEPGVTISAQPISPVSEYAFGALAGNRLSTGNLDRKATVWNLTTTGTVESSIVIDDAELVDGNRSAWINRHTLALVDPRFGVRFYNVSEEGAWSALGVWRPAARPFYVRSIAALPDGTVAVGLLPTGIVVGTFTVQPREDGWVTK